MNRPSVSVACLLCLSVPLPLSFALPPVAVPDSFDTEEDQPLDQPVAFGVLGNDNANGQPVEAVLVTPPGHGTLDLRADGSFTYSPALNYNGADSFTYRGRTIIPPVVFTIDPAQSRVQIDGDLRTEFGNDTDSDESRLSGTISAVINPGPAPFTDARIVSLQAKLIDQADLDFGLGCSIFGCLATIGVHTRIVEPDFLTLGLAAPGAAAPVGPGGIFHQTGNSVTLGGIIDITSGGLAATLIPAGPQSLDTTATLDFNNCVITSSGGTLTLKVPIDYTGRFYMDEADQTNNYADIRVRTAFTGSSGFIVATAPATANLSEQSAIVTASIAVTPINDPPVAAPESYVTLRSEPLVIPASAAPSTEDLVAPGATWRFRYDGQNLGTAWRAWHFNDTDWASGPALLGHGDSDVITSIRPAGTPNHATAYFRHAFTLDRLSDTRPGLQLFIKRDDAAAVFINGVEVFRDTNLPANAGFADYATSARPEEEEDLFFEVGLSRTVLFEGRNFIAAEVHQVSDASGDVLFDLRLTRAVGASGVLANDSDVDSPPSALSAATLAPPAHGTLQLAPNGAFVYTPEPGFDGTDSFVYRVTDTDPNPAPMSLLPRGSTWKYHATGTDPGVDWTTGSFNDASWPSGPAELGYGDEADGRPEATNIRPDPGTMPIHPAYYFRKTFPLPVDRLLVTSLTGRILRDDAAAIFLNGEEIFRDNHLGAGATFADYATGQTPSETAFAEFAINPARLVDGDNSVAVEVHQAGPASSDVSFDFELLATTRAGARVTLRVLADDADQDSISDTWERFHGLDDTSAADAPLDPDADGRSNRDEFLAATDPNLPSSRLDAVHVSDDGAGLVLRFAEVSPQRTYQLEGSIDLITWAGVGSPFAPTASVHEVVVPLQPGVPVRYYRLVALYSF